MAHKPTTKIRRKRREKIATVIKKLVAANESPPGYHP
jgi:hypothetical protein